LRDFAGCFVDYRDQCYIEHSVQELAVQRIASPAPVLVLAASLLLGACAAIDTERKDDPVFFGAAGGASGATSG
jgi:hypothetical protein